MTRLLSHVSQTSLGETCAFYTDYIGGNLPTSLRDLQKFVTTVLSTKDSSSSSPFLTFPPPPDWIRDYIPAAVDYKTLVAFLLPCAVALAIMSWRNFFRPPVVNDNDYSYISPNQSRYEAEPDTLILRHRHNTYELPFPAYAINEGRLSVGQLRQRAAEVTQTPDPKRIKLLYKGNLLDDDTLPCRNEGLKQQSEVLCVVSEVQPGQRTPSDPGSDLEESNKNSDSPQEPEAPQARKRNRTRNKKKKKLQKQRAEDELSAPVEPPRPTSSGPSSSMPASAPNLKLFTTPIAKAHALMSYLQGILLPLCEEYIANPPAEPKARDFEYKKLSETILAQVILTADGIDPETDEERLARRMLIKEAQKTLGRLDAARDS
ncbi:hypothetical protein FE257_012810 [Aspergillus nanangensis]|uniref:BAG domain-containing protein n=1 Tax=Aspergillus nanangensis TaxID=2582783 RepID=A0AAD4CGQ8_ASPNN|nr:hypothetical protein FE257_012810 [Aspergillus nanangensis]